MLLVSGPFILLLMLAVKLTSRGPAIYSQLRVGLHGKQFYCHKLRTMRADAEAATGPVWARSNDPRVTFLGNIFRKLHLDELPQLWNVFRGEMLLVGPRPERPEFTQRLGVEVPGYLNRLIVMPGITGLAQINLPPDTDLESVRRKIVLDLEYAQHAGLGMDLRIILCTALRLAYFSSRTFRKVFGVYRDPHKLMGEPAVFAFRVHVETPELADDDSSFDIPTPHAAGLTPGA
jgi:lipopolysaccharide/colanic/teichoic acid biosynthesis glycosyltransferase